MLRVIGRLCGMGVVAGAVVGIGSGAVALAAQQVFNDFVVTAVTTAPTPASLLVVGTGLSGLGVLSRRLRRK